MKIEVFFRRWAKGNVFMLRLAKYIQLLNMFMLAKLFVNGFESKTVGYIALISSTIILAIISLIDYYRVIGKEVGDIFRKNEEWKKLRKDVNKVLEILNEKE